MFKRLVCLCLCALLALSCTACRETEPPATTAAPTTQAPTTVPPTTEAPTEAPTTVPPTTEAPTEPPRWTQEVHSGLREDGTFDEHTLFIGDSLTFLMITHYLRTYECLGDAKYAVKAGVQMTAFFDERYPMQYDAKLNCLYPEEFEGLTMAEAAAAMGEDLHAVYIMLGTNYTPSATAEDYIEICDFILENCPHATVHLQTIPYSPIVKYETVNDRIRGAYEHYQEQGIERVMLLDTCTAIGNNLISDKVHMNDTGRENWYMALLAHARDNELPQ